MQTPWYKQAVFYHIYPLGFCGAPEQNDYHATPVERLSKVIEWIPHFKDMGITAIYFGPLFEATSHGYDTVNYYEVDRRLGTNDTLKRVIHALHANNIKVVLDGVFNHVSRDFFAFQDVRQHQQHSMFKEWFCQLNFQQRSPFNDPFSYQGWNTHYSLVKLNLTSPDVIEHLLNAIRKWIAEFQIDGLRLDVADNLDFDFMKKLSAFTKTFARDFWLMGEVIHGDYNRWANPEMLHATTNYECYKGLYSSHNDKNYFEIAYSLNRQFGQEYGIYQPLYLYNFADNHDVNRVASSLKEQRHLYPLYLILLTMPGIPSIYYGSEWGVEGQKTMQSDRPLRPELCLAHMPQQKHAALKDAITRMIRVRRDLPALQHGRYKQLFVAAEQFAFLREHERERVIVAVNASHQPVTIQFPLQTLGEALQDCLNHDHIFPVYQGKVSLEIPACWGRILLIQ